MTTNPPSPTGRLRVFIETKTVQPDQAFLPDKARRISAGIAIMNDCEDRPQHVLTVYGLAGSEDYMRMAALAEAMRLYDMPNLQWSIHCAGLQEALIRLVAGDGVMDAKKGKLYKGAEFLPNLKAPVRERRISFHTAGERRSGWPAEVAAKAAKLGDELAAEDILSHIELVSPKVYGIKRLEEIEGRGWWVRLNGEEKARADDRRH